jgi:hypothetical protein
MTPAYHKAKVASRFEAKTKDEPVKVKADDGGMQITKGRFRFIDDLALQSVQPPEWLVPDTLYAEWTAWVRRSSSSSPSLGAATPHFQRCLGSGTPGGIVLQDSQL